MLENYAKIHTFCMYFHCPKVFGTKSWKLTKHYQNCLCTWKLIFPLYLFIAICLSANFPLGPLWYMYWYMILSICVLKLWNSLIVSTLVVAILYWLPQFFRYYFILECHGYFKIIAFNSFSFSFMDILFS